MCILVTQENGDIENIGSDHRENNELRERKPKLKSSNKSIKKRLKFVLTPSDSVQTDLDGLEPLCRVVRIHPNGKLMATGTV